MINSINDVINFRDTNTVYQFHGCWWHGCQTCFPNDRDSKQYGRSHKEKRDHTTKIAEYIRQSGYGLEEIWECEWRTYRRGNAVTNSYLYPTESRYRMTSEEILQFIRNGQLFGAVLCDIHVPEDKKDYFAEMPPIFKNTTVHFEDIGRHMQSYLKSSDQTFSDRRYLIGSMFGNKQLFITPLLQFYLKLGLVVTTIHEVIEFSPRKCFDGFADRVTNDRRAGDRDPALKVIGDTSKLIGESITFVDRRVSRKILSVMGVTKCIYPQETRFMGIP